MSATGRQRTVRWVLQVLLLVGSLGQPAIWFLLSAVVPLALDAPLRPLATGRGRLVGLTARVVGVAALAIGPSHLVLGVAPILSAATQSGLVFAAAYLLSRDAVPLLGRAAHR